MTNFWFLLALAAPFFFAVVNHTDKYLIEKLFKNRGIGTLVIFSALIGLPASLIILIFDPTVLDTNLLYIFLMIANGIMYVGWILPYLYALSKDETSTVVPLFQLSSVISLVMGSIFLKEQIAPLALFGCFMILVGGVGLSIDFSQKNQLRLKMDVLALMLVANTLIAINGIVFKFVVVEETFWKTTFWNYIGVFLAAIPLLAIKPYRKEFIRVMTSSRVFAITANAFNEVVNIVGLTLFNFALTLAPVAVVYFVSGGFQPFFALIIGIILSIFAPHIASENTGRRHVISKLIFIAIMFLGSYLLIL